MAIERCCSCERNIDLDYDEIWYKIEYPFLYIGEFEALCFDCISDEDWDKIEEMENKKGN